MGIALITGATAGLGLEFAWQLAAARHDLVLVARTENRLNEVAEQLRAVAGVNVEVICADLSVVEDVERVAERLRITGDEAGETRHPVGLLVNNAGFGYAQRFIDGDVDVELRAFDVMARAVLILTRTAVGQMVPRGRGAILNVGSIAALTASGTYSAHKAWVRNFTEGLAHELAGTGVTATAVAPGLTRTEFHSRAELNTAGLPSIGWLSAERVVSDALTAVRRGQVLCTPTKRYQLAAAALRLAPRAVVRALGKPGLGPTN
ncbi:MAG: SDR family NAD(P)-dependent oxidoreductase [Promicromonosporaceae bacterium]|nr:SDR family NAD(P)-dependent oxidoreductase [Promicromonosporaceae bacterium]